MSLQDVLSARTDDELAVLQVFIASPGTQLDVAQIAVRTQLAPSAAHAAVASLFADDLLDGTAGANDRMSYRLPVVPTSFKLSKWMLLVGVALAAAAVAVVVGLPWWVSIVPVVLVIALLTGEMVHHRTSVSTWSKANKD